MSTKNVMLTLILIMWIFRDASAQCPQQQLYEWTTWFPTFGSSATGVINYNSQPVSVTMTSNFDFGFTGGIFGYNHFNGFESTVPDIPVPATTWSAGTGGTTTMCFSQPLHNPVLLLASLGQSSVPVTLSFSKKYDAIYDGGGMLYPNDSTIIGEEGYAIIRFRGDFNCITINSTTPEYYTNITWGINPPLFHTSITQVSASCHSITFEASGGSTYEWSGGDYPHAAVNTLHSSGTYFLTITDNNGCMVSTSIDVLVSAAFYLNTDTAICAGNNYLGHTVTGTYIDTLISASGCDTILTSNVLIKELNFSTVDKAICTGENYLGYTIPGTYTYTLTSANACDTLQTLHLSVVAFPKPDLGPNQELCSGKSLTLSPGSFQSYLWSDHSTGDHITVNQAGSYAVTVTNTCHETATDEIKVFITDCSIYAPSAFTPNNDGTNDVFRVHNGHNLQQFKLVIYNRWGQQLFETRNYLAGWDGTYMHQAQEEGVYVWIYEHNENGKAISKHGTVLLRR